MIAQIRKRQRDTVGYEYCQRCRKPGRCDAHELLSRARGGSITDPANIVMLDRPCHDDVTFRHHLIPDAARWVHTRQHARGNTADAEDRPG